MNEKLFTVKEVAKSGAIGYKYHSILNLCKKGLLGHTRATKSKNSKIFISQSEIDKFKKSFTK